MNDSRYEIYSNFTSGLPFVFNKNLIRTPKLRSIQANWHENVEIQLCVDGEGVVFIDGIYHNFRKSDVAIINSNSLHHTGSEKSITYSCLIIDVNFFRNVGIDVNAVKFNSVVKNDYIVNLFDELSNNISVDNDSLRFAKINVILLKILIEILEKHTTTVSHSKLDYNRDAVKSTLLYIRENYDKKFTLDDLAKQILFNKYALCHEFKRLTGQTIIENLNEFRCVKAQEFLAKGFSVQETAALCGFDNLSYFTKTFKNFTGKLPSKCKLNNK